jgi:hypothetical protein
MRTLYQTLERLALDMTYGEDISQMTRAVALIFHDEIYSLPWSKRQAARDKLREPRSVHNLVALVLREMQRHARAILLEQGVDHLDSPLSEEHAAIVHRIWNNYGQAPAWLAFESQIDKLAAHYAKED